jgi:hypothetical protein
MSPMSPMSPLTVERLAALPALCRQYGVARLEVFGSAATDAYDATRSDIDFIVEFGEPAALSLFERYFGLKQALESLFGRQADLVMAGAMRNPHFIDSANRSRRTLYASALAATA